MFGKLISFILNCVVIVAAGALMLGAASLFLTPETQAATNDEVVAASVEPAVIVALPAATAIPTLAALPAPTIERPTGPIRCEKDVWGLPLRPEGFRVTARFGYKAANSSYTKSLVGVGAVQNNTAGIFHSGIDLAADTGDPVYSVMQGNIKYVGYSDQYGKHIIIENATQRVLLAHLSQTFVKKGVDVWCGQLLGLAGGTGKALTGPHLHLELREKKRDRAVDPFKIIDAAMKASSPVLGVK
jgi:murein DD-endopeptidase MepM/ murein hydrolase activator NlpD